MTTSSPPPPSTLHQFAASSPPPPHSSDESSATSSSSHDDPDDLFHHGAAVAASSSDAALSTMKQSSSWLEFGLSCARSLVLEAPLVAMWSGLLILLLLQHSYLAYVEPLVDSYERHGYRHDLYDDYHHEFTYYNRHCSIKDITTSNSNDLLIQPDFDEQQAAAVMLQHGAVAIRDLLQKDTATRLRQYLADKHTVSHTLGWNEKFWEEQTRLALALGAGDDDIIVQALQQVGTHPVLNKTLRGLLGDDPAIVEISTLSSLRGAKDQGIHSDSDWFGSSLLYGRSFLHSYSMFIALQDTTQALGATTVCPGTHYCADQFLEDVCLNDSNQSAFEISTNGQTGADGVLEKGSGFLFNQNVWHRGSANVDERNMDRIMFIMTFVTRAKRDKQHERIAGTDYRRQGLGTFYYQRWNMWGHTFQDLKHAATILKQPVAALRALGLWKPAHANWGIWWPEQLAQQMANAEEFYANYELEEFRKKVLDAWHVPEQLRSKSEAWGDFIPETAALWIDLAIKINAYVLAIYVGLGLLGGMVWNRVTVSSRSSAPTHNRTVVPPFLKRLVLMHGVVGMLALAAFWYVDRTELARAVQSGAIYTRPFSVPDDYDERIEQVTIDKQVGPTTLPERTDVLIGTRYHADFLASYNRFLDYHPGNMEWLELIASISSNNMPTALQRAAIAAFVTAKDHEHVFPYHERRRFLWQDPTTGSWMILPHAAAIQETLNEVVMAENPQLQTLVTRLRHSLAEARFGAARDTAMSRRFVPQQVEQWLEQLLPPADHAKDDTTKLCRPFVASSSSSMPPQHEQLSLRLSTFQLPTLSSLVKDKPQPLHRRRTPYHLATSTLTRRRNDDEDDDDDDFYVGERVWVQSKNKPDAWYEADITKMDDRDCDDDECWCTIEYLDGGGSEYLDCYQSVRHYELLKEGDRVTVDYRRNGSEFFDGTITHVHPNGLCAVAYDDGDFQDAVKRQFLQLLD